MLVTIWNGDFKWNILFASTESKGLVSQIKILKNKEGLQTFSLVFPPQVKIIFLC